MIRTRKLKFILTLQAESRISAPVANISSLSGLLGRFLVLLFSFFEMCLFNTTSFCHTFLSLFLNSTAKAVSQCWSDCLIGPAILALFELSSYHCNLFALAINNFCAHSNSKPNFSGTFLSFKYLEFSVRYMYERPTIVIVLQCI